MAEQRQRGLPSLRESKDTRRRAIVFGRVRMRDAAPQFWLWTIVLFIAFGVGYWRYAEGELESQKSAVMAKQRAFAVELGPKLTPLRDRVEGWAIELAGPWQGDLLADELDLAKLSRSKGLYLRLMVDDASDPEQIRKAALHSLHDGFTSCLFQRKQNVVAGSDKKPCRAPSDCQSGEFCNEFNVCSRPTQPYNLRLMYRAMRVLSSKWTDELHQATGDYQVRLFERDLEKVAREAVPAAVELMTQAKYATILLDEAPETGLPKVPMLNRDGGVSETRAQQIQASPHTIRLGIWELETGKPLARLRIEAGARFVPVGNAATASLKTRRAQQRQVNNCSIAETLRSKVRERSAQTDPAPGATDVPTVP